jgi:hypothetical protein
MSRGILTWMAGLIVLAILVNILVILGGSGGRWRRGLLLPWLLFYGFGIVGCFVTHIYFTSLCWREEKVEISIFCYFNIHLLTLDYFQIIGLVCHLTGFVFLVLWSLVWIVSAQITEKTKTIISRPSPLGFQRL